MGLTVVPGNMIEDGTITDSNFPNTEITSADMALDPRNASNISSGDVPLAQLGNIPAADLTGLDDDIALLGFKTAANGSLAKYNLLDQTVDAFEDASGVDAGSSTNEVRNASKYYSGQITVTPTRSGNWDDTGTGGPAGYKWYRWTTVTSSGTFTTDAAEDYKYLVVAGGGGGGAPYGGGGGAGGVRYSDTTAQPHTYSLSLAAGTFGVVVGAGGAGGSSAANTASVIGGNSSFATISATGGGRGGGTSGSGDDEGGDGGSGGGGNESGPIGYGNAGSYSPVEGYNGSPGHGAASNFLAGSGGGASQAGVIYVVNSVAGTGGAGVSVDGEGDGSGYVYGGGGGGSSNANGNPVGNGGPGGSGGGGGGSRYYNGSSGTGGTGARNNGSPGTNGGAGGAAGANSGGGGGGGMSAAPQLGGAGGSGIVIIRMADTTQGAGNMTLVSTATTAQAVPTKGDMVMTYTDGAGTAVINTNIKGYVSRDGGTTYTQGTLASQGTTGGHTILSFHDLDISGQPSGSSMRYKIETLVQSASMDTRIQAVSLGWS